MKCLGYKAPLEMPHNPPGPNTQAGTHVDIGREEPGGTIIFAITLRAVR